MGSIRKRDRAKKYEARYWDGSRQESKAFSRRVDAERWLVEREAAALSGTWVDPKRGEIEYEEWAMEWLQSLDLKPTTYVNYESNLRSRILPTFGKKHLAKIDTRAVRLWQQRLREKNLSAASIRQARQVLSASLEQAVQERLIPHNPVEGVRAPRVLPRNQIHLTAGQVASFAWACECVREGSGRLIAFMAWTGLRWGEATALRWRQVDPKRRRVAVREAVSDVRGRLIVGSPKTHESRVVIVPQFVIDELGVPGDPEDLVFAAPKGGYLRNSNFRRSVWDRAREMLADPEKLEELRRSSAGAGGPGRLVGIPVETTPHDLRHTAAALMIASEATVLAVMRSLGHASASMTLDQYGGLFEEDLEALAERMEMKFAAEVGYTEPVSAAEGTTEPNE